jgi:ATP-dependent DNA helicase RecG
MLKTELMEQRGDFRTELRPVPGTSLDDLDLHRLDDYFKRIRQQLLPKDSAGRSILFASTVILSDQEPGAPCTTAGLLLFGTDPNRFLPQAGIDAVAYPGREKDYAARERLSLRGPLTPLLRQEEGRPLLLENGLVERALEFVRRNSGVTAELVDGARRVERPDYPVEALREAIVNALVHRDYLLSSTDIELSLYEDRLEIISPGNLPNGITPERMRVGCRASRNQLIKDVMRDYGYLEHMGMGIPRKLIPAMRQQNGTEPDLIEGNESFTVRLWKRPPQP